MGKAVIFSAPSGAGKTTIVRHLMTVEAFHLAFSVSATSRTQRGNEVNGQDYYFLTPEDFLKRAQMGEFVEWEEVYKDQYYGTLKSEIERIWAEGKNVIFDVDVQGGMNLKKIFGDNALSVFVQPPSIEVLTFRLRNRSTESPEKIAMRVNKASAEMKFAEKFDVQLLNDDLSKSLAEAESLLNQFLETK
jgi:guanylate kinase